MADEVVTEDAVRADPGARGSLTIADLALTRIAAEVVRGVPGVAAEQRGYPKVAWQHVGVRSRVAVELATLWPSSSADVTVQVQTRVAGELARQAGQEVDSVAVTVRDVVRPQLAAAAARVR